MAYVIFVPWLGIKPRALAVKMWCPNNWTTREFTKYTYLRGRDIYKAILHFKTFIYFFGHTKRHVGSWFPDQGSNLHLLHWEHGILTTRPPGKSLYYFKKEKKKRIPIISWQLKLFLIFNHLRNWKSILNTKFNFSRKSMLLRGGKNREVKVTRVWLCDPMDYTMEFYR